ncbi:unnamed protein product [Malus baccata var. baccata]
MCSTFSLAAKAYTRDSNGKFPPQKYMVIATTRRASKQIISMPVFPELSIQISFKGSPRHVRWPKKAAAENQGWILALLKNHLKDAGRYVKNMPRHVTWGRRTDELVDGPNSVHMSSDVLDMWEVRLQDIFKGRPHDIIDVAPTHIVFSFSLDIKCYAWQSLSFPKRACAFWVIRYRYFCKKVIVQIWSALFMYRGILVTIEDNGYDNFTKRAYLLASGSETAAMESIPLRHSISATNQSFLLKRRRNPENQFQSSSRRFHLHTPTRRFRIHSKLSGFRDSKGYARPSRLLPATEVKICTDNSVEKLFSSLRDDGSQSLYKRIPSSIITNHARESEDGVLHFQRGSVDEFTFEGPKLGNVGAVWISLESGQWRLGSVSLTVICGKQSSLEEKDEEKLQYTGFSYNFAVEDILLGEGSDSSMVQLRPCLVTELSGVDPVTIFTKSLPESTLPVSGISNKETMREYEDLKLSLLLYDAMLIFVGTSVASFSAGENISFAFLTGGMGGFFYLLLLQRSVDGLPAAELTSTNIGQTNQTFGGSKVPIFVLALAIGFTLLTVKYGSGDVPIVFTPKQLIAGMIGFLACKVSVVLAAVKPLPISLKINEPFRKEVKNFQMCSTISFAGKTYIGESNGRIRRRISMVTAAKAQVITAPKQRSRPVFPELSIQGIPLADLHVQEIVQRQSQTRSVDGEGGRRRPQFNPSFLEEAYERCKNLCAEYAKTFYLGTLLMTEERQKAIWAIYGENSTLYVHVVSRVWCRRTDELVDGPNSNYMSSEVLNRWEQRLEDIFEGRPYDMLDAALTHTVFNFPLDIKPFRDMIEGMRMDTQKCRYHNFQELYLYCYYVAGTVGLMSVPVMGIASDSRISAQSTYDSALYLGIGNQLTNILRDVGEDAMRGRVYLPQDELAQFGLCDNDVFSRKVTDQWRAFMKKQITRARFYFNLAEEGASQLDKASRWPVWSSLLIYRNILDAIEDNDYDNLTKRAYVKRAKKLLMLPLAYTRSLSTHNLMSQ